jgi:hypothetical protein
VKKKFIIAGIGIAVTGLVVMMILWPAMRPSSPGNKLPGSSQAPGAKATPSPNANAGSNGTSTPGSSKKKSGRTGSGTQGTGGTSSSGQPGSSGPVDLTLNLPRVAWEGGPSYYASLSKATAWNNANFFPLGVWFESVAQQSDVDTDKAAGLNTYVELTSNSDLSLVRAGGMYAVQGQVTSGVGSETIGDLLTDEADMTYGPGNDPWSGVEGWDTCIPIQDNGGQCGYTVMQQFLTQSQPGNGRLKYANYGKGVMMWESDNDAAAFINGYTSATSADLYFYTDPNLCPSEAQTYFGIPSNECNRAANYGLVIDRLRALDALDGHRQPIYGFVEVGHPATEDSAPTITGDQIAGAVFSSLIHEARGIIYFNHSFGGSCQSQHVLRDACGAAIRPKVIETNNRVKDLAAVLNTQSYQHSFNASLSTMLKVSGDSYYIFAMQKRPNTNGSYTLTLPSDMKGSTVQVLYENRTLPISGGKFTDSFAAEYTYHIYKITP